MKSVYGFLMTGMLAGWFAGMVIKGRGFGVIGDIIVGMIGAVLGGWLFSLLGLMAYGMAGSLVMAVIGAVMLLALVRTS